MIIQMGKHEKDNIGWYFVFTPNFNPENAQKGECHVTSDQGHAEIWTPEKSN